MLFTVLHSEIQQHSSVVTLTDRYALTSFHYRNVNTPYKRNKQLTNNNHLLLPAILGILELSLLIINLLLNDISHNFTNKAWLVIFVATDDLYSLLYEEQIMKFPFICLKQYKNSGWRMNSWSGNKLWSYLTLTYLKNLLNANMFNLFFISNWQCPKANPGCTLLLHIPAW